MSWRVRPEEILLEVGRLFGSKVGLQQLNVDVGVNPYSPPQLPPTQMVHISVVLAEFLAAAVRHQLGTGVNRQLLVATAHPAVHHHWHLQGRACGHQENLQEEGGYHLNVVVGDKAGQRRQPREHRSLRRCLHRFAATDVADSDRVLSER